MKKILFTLLLFFITLCANAQVHVTTDVMKSKLTTLCSQINVPMKITKIRFFDTPEIVSVERMDTSEILWGIAYSTDKKSYIDYEELSSIITFLESSADEINKTKLDYGKEKAGMGVGAKKGYLKKEGVSILEFYYKTLSGEILAFYTFDGQKVSILQTDVSGRLTFGGRDEAFDYNGGFDISKDKFVEWLRKEARGVAKAKQYIEEQMRK